MAAATHFQTVQKIYIAFYQRPADPAGLKYWADRIDVAGGDASAVVAAFANSPEAVALYGTIDATTIGSVVDKIYMALFNKAPDAAGKQFYVDGFNAGTFTPGTIALNILNGAMGDDAVAVNNKAQVANSFTQQVDGRALTDASFGTGNSFNATYKGDTDATAARDILKNVTSSPATVLNQSQVTEEIKTKIADATDPIMGQTGGQTFTLTAGSDTGAAFTGGAGNDTYTAGVSEASGGGLVDTLQNVDQLDGGLGTDTLNATLNGGVLVTPTLKSIENVNVRVTTATGGINFVAATGVTAVNVNNSTAAANIQNTGAAALGVSNQNTAVTFGGSTATALTLNLDTVGTKATDIAINLGTTTANAATSFVINAKDAHVTFAEAVAGAATTTASVAATGSNEITFAGADLASLTSLTATGAGDADFTGGTLTALKTLTVADGGVKAIINNQTAAAVTVTTGAGADTIAVSGAGLKSIATGAGKDAVTVGNAAQVALAVAVAAAGNAAAVNVLTAAAVTAGTITVAQQSTIDTAATGSVAAAATATNAIVAAAGQVAATATVDLGAGDDSLTLGAAFAAGATLAGGDGTDTLAMAKAGYATVTAGGAYTAAVLAKVTGFEVLGITDALANTDSINVSAITGITSFKAGAGVTTGNTAAATNLGANSTVELAGAAANNGTLTVSLKTDTTADAMTLVLNKDYTDNNDITSDALAAAHTVVAAEIETLTVNSTGKMAPIATKVDGYKADVVTNTLTLTGSDKLTSITVTGDQKLTLATTAAMTKLATIDASANTAGVTIDASLAAATSVALTIKGTAKADTIKGGALGDTITLGGGNDTMDYIAGVSKIGTGKFDTITDFSANTYGNSAVTAGAAGTGAAADATKWTGDVLKFDGNAAAVTAVVDVFTNAANATTFLANNANAANGIVAALDSSTGNLYIDNTADGVADFFISLTGVTTITAAAFQVV